MKRFYFLLLMFLSVGPLCLGQFIQYRTIANGTYGSYFIWDGTDKADPGESDWTQLPNSSDQPSNPLDSKTLYIRNSVTNSLPYYSIRNSAIYVNGPSGALTYSSAVTMNSIEPVDYYVDNGGRLIFNKGVKFGLGTTRIYMEPGGFINMIDYMKVTASAAVEIYLHDPKNLSDPADDVKELVMTFGEGYYDFPWNNITMAMEKVVTGSVNPGDPDVISYNLKITQKILNEVPLAADPDITTGILTFNEVKEDINVKLNGEFENKTDLLMTLGKGSNFSISLVTTNAVNASLTTELDGGVLTFGNNLDNSGNFIYTGINGGAVNFNIGVNNDPSGYMAILLNKSNGTIKDNLNNDGIFYLGLENQANFTNGNVFINSKYLDFSVKGGSVLQLDEFRNIGYLGDVQVDGGGNPSIVNPAVIDGGSMIMDGNFTYNGYGSIEVTSNGLINAKGYFPMGNSKQGKEEAGKPETWPIHRKIYLKYGRMVTEAEVAINAYSYIQVGDAELSDPADKEAVKPTIKSKVVFKGPNLQINKYAQVWVHDLVQVLADNIQTAGYDKDGNRWYVFDTQYSDPTIPVKTDLTLANPYNPWPSNFAALAELASGQCDIEWQGPDGSCTPDVGLPVELLSFSANAEGLMVKVQWTTATEENNDYFTIERSLDGINYIVLGKVSGSGNSNEVLEYTFTDGSPAPGISYYRLKQTDFDGTTETFRPVVVQFAGLSNALRLYPNPSDGSLVHIQAAGLTKNQIANLFIRNLTGQVVFEDEILVGSSGAVVAELSVQGALSSGTYLVQISDGAANFRSKLVIQ